MCSASTPVGLIAVRSSAEKWNGSIVTVESPNDTAQKWRDYESGEKHKSERGI